jgi:hypothetical protein
MLNRKIDRTAMVRCWKNRRQLKMQKIDAGYIYELGAAIRPLRTLGFDSLTSPWVVWGALTNARDTITQFVSASIYSSALRTAPAYAQKLIEQLQILADKIEYGEIKQDDVLKPIDMIDITKAFASFEPVMIAEMQAASIFYVPPRGAFDNNSLIEEGESLFPDSLLSKVPETEHDVKQGARCIAFALPTASGFHFHRANEAVLRKYFDQVAGPDQRPNNSTMGTLLAKLKKLDKGDKSIIAALDNIKEFHRNPLMHPEHTLADVGEAISLYCAIRSAMSYMLDALPAPEMPVD